MLELVDLEEFVEYSIRVRAFTSVGAGPYTPVTTAQTLPGRKSFVHFHDRVLEPTVKPLVYVFSSIYLPIGTSGFSYRLH